MSFGLRRVLLAAGAFAALGVRVNLGCGVGRQGSEYCAEITEQVDGFVHHFIAQGGLGAGVVVVVAEDQFPDGVGVFLKVGQGVLGSLHTKICFEAIICAR